MSDQLSHLDENSKVQMVDVSHKPDTLREAIARGEVCMQQSTFKLICEGGIKKGDLFATARLAGIMAAKRTSELIPLCHPLPISYISVELFPESTLPGLIVTSTVHTTGKTGVEMEALTAVAVAALTIYDMAKAVDKTMKIQNIRLLEKHGGISGDVVNP